MHAEKEAGSDRRLLVIDSAPFCGGAQESLWELLGALRERGWRLHLLSADHTPGGLLERARAAQMEFTPLTCRHWPATPTGLWQFWQDRKVFRQLWRQRSTDHAPSAILVNCLRSALLLRALAPLPTPTLLYDRDVEAPPLIPWLLARTGLHVVCVSQAVHCKWKGLPAARDGGVLPNGFDLERVRAAVPPIQKPENFTILQVADLIPWKGHSLFLQTLAQARTKMPEIRGIIRGRCRTLEGENYLQKLQQEAAELGITDAVQFQTQAGTAWAAMAAADLLVSCSQQEAFGRVVLEALILSKPVLAVNAAGPAEYLVDCPAATLATPDPQALARQVGIWKQRLESGEDIAAALFGWLQRFTLATQVDRLDQMLGKLIR